ncbi:MAG: MFS transporter [Clostridia bacterium]|nr:MFS transporter [Clostridia bacterium]
MTEKKIKLVKYACYTVNITMAAIGNLSPILFLTFRGLYNVSYSLLGLLIVINFTVQLIVDLIFSFFSHKFNIEKTVKIIPYISIVGLLFYAAAPFLFPGNVYLGLVLGTVIFSSAAGLIEVLISPVIAALPAKDPDREMSKLHSVYAWGLVGFVIFATLFLFLVGNENWQWLAIAVSAVPLFSAVLFSKAELPEMKTPEKTSATFEFIKDKGLWLCFFAIFLGGASECTMAQWSSGYLEQAAGIPKLWGDIFGVALNAVMLGIGRTLYSKIGKNIGKVLFFGALGAVACYFTAAVCNVSFIGLFACAFTGFCTSMMWPGSLIVAQDRFPAGGVFIFAMMAAGGDLGASVGPQLIGIVTDAVSASPIAAELASTLGLLPEQLGMKIGMIGGMLFPLAAIPIYFHIWKRSKRTVA